jgi:inner membrane transporter RhtA
MPPYDPGIVDRMPPAVFIGSSAIFHYLGPSLAVLLFAHVGVLGVAWLRVATAALVFVCWRRPFRTLARASAAQRRAMLGLGILLAAMNSAFYLATDRLPLSTVGAIEFLGVIVLAVVGTRSPRNLAALVLAVGGVAILTDVRWANEAWGFAFAFVNCLGFMGYVMLGHRIATSASDGRNAFTLSGIDQLAAAMLIAAVVITPVSISQASAAFGHPTWLLWGAGVGVCSSVIPYVTDQLAMARLPRATFAFLLCLLPASATVIGLVMLHQVPGVRDLIGVAAVAVGLAIRRDG